MPFMVSPDPGKLLEDLRKLYQTTPSAFADAKLSHVNQSLLAAACGAAHGDDLRRAAGHLRDAPPQEAEALTALMHGAPVELNDASQFFDVLKVAARMHFHACEDICQQKVTSKDYRIFPIQLRLSVEHGQAIRQQLKGWQAAEVPHLTDAIILIKTDDPEKPKPIRVHSIILASSCDYLRGLWSCGLTESPTSPELGEDQNIRRARSMYEEDAPRPSPRSQRARSQTFEPFSSFRTHSTSEVGGTFWTHSTVLDQEDATAATLLIQAVYGDAVQAETMDDLLHLCCLADRWQCRTVLNAALATVEDALEKAGTGQAAVDILGWPVQAPRSVLQTVARCVSRWFNQGLDFFPEVKSMPFAAGVQLLDLLEHEDSDSDTFASNNEFLEEVHSRLLQCLCDASAETSGLVQLKCETMGNILQSRARLTVRDGPQGWYLGERISLWASRDSKTGKGEALVRTAQLLSENMPDVVQAALRQALCSCICTPGIACTVVNAIFSEIKISVHGSPDVALERSLLMTALPALEPVARDLLAVVALDWLVGHVDSLVSCCAAWQDLQPKPFTEAAKAMILNIAKEQVVEVQKEHDDKVVEVQKEQEVKVDKENGNHGNKMASADEGKQDSKRRGKIGKMDKTGSKKNKMKGKMAEEEVEEANEEEKKNVEDVETKDECDKNTIVEEEVQLEDGEMKEEKNRRVTEDEPEEEIQLEDGKMEEENNRQEAEIFGECGDGQDEPFGKCGEGQMPIFTPPQEGSESLQTTPNCPDSCRTGCTEKPKTREMLVKEVVSQWVGAAPVTGASEAFTPPQEALASLQTAPNCPDSCRNGCPEKPKTREMLVREVVSQWVGAASVASASEAIRLVAPGKGKLFDMLMENVAERWQAAEHQNAVLGGGRHEAELSVAVASARKEGDAKVRAECDHTVALLRSQLADANNRETQAKESHQKVIEDTRLRVMAAFPTEGAISRRGCLCNMFFK